MSESVEVVVLKDQQGNYYVLPRQGLEQARVGDEERAELEELLNAGGGGDRELSDAELETVAGGVTLNAVGTFSVPSGFGAGNLQKNWSSGPV